jgi:hypothetical protein
MSFCNVNIGAYMSRKITKSRAPWEKNDHQHCFNVINLDVESRHTPANLNLLFQMFFLPIISFKRLPLFSSKQSVIYV